MRFLILALTLASLSACATLYDMKNCTPTFDKCKAGEPCEKHYDCEKP